MIKLALNRLFRSEIAFLFKQNCRDDTNSDTEFESESEYDKKIIEFDQKWSKMTGFLIDFDIFN